MSVMETWEVMHTVIVFLCSRSRLPLMFFLRPYLTICMF